MFPALCILQTSNCFAELPVSWPDCAVQPAMLDLVIKQFVAFSTKKSERKRIIAGKQKRYLLPVLEAVMKEFCV